MAPDALERRFGMCVCRGDLQELGNLISNLVMIKEKGALSIHHETC